MKKGIDISVFQGTIDWERVKNQIDFAIVRCGVTSVRIDDNFHRNMRECNRLGIPVGVYHFAYAWNAAGAIKEAKLTIEACKQHKLQLPIFWDFEYETIHYGARNGFTFTPTAAQEGWIAFRDTVIAAGYEAGIYTGSNLIAQYFGNLITPDELWLAQWPNKVDFNNPPRKCALWQYTSSGQIDGIYGRVDLDVMYRDIPKAEPVEVAPQLPVVKPQPLIDTVVEVQAWLNDRWGAELVLDGIYGWRTRAALVKALQKQLGVKTDGIYGRLTKAVTKNLAYGMSGELVQILQALLVCNGHPRAFVDGIFGKGTLDSVKAYQAKAGLVPDGIAGKKTFEALCTR